MSTLFRRLRPRGFVVSLLCLAIPPALVVDAAAPRAAHAAPAFRDSTVSAHYGRDRQVHFTHLRLELTPDFGARSIQGLVTHTFIPLREKLSSLTLDCSDLTVTEVTGRNLLPLRFRQEESRLWIDLGGAHGPGETLSVAVHYHGRPARGVYFNEPDSLHPSRPMQLFTQGEAEDSHYWFPCYDYPDDKATSEMLASAPPGMMAVSNGKLIEVRPGRDGWKTYHWYESVPHSTYLNSLVIGDFKPIEDSYRGISLVSYVKPADYERGRENLGRLRDMVQFFSEKTGVLYPYEKYSQTFVAEFQHGGMENVSATTNTETSLYDARARLDSRSESLVSHELAHQWFGDLVTCRDWAHAWLNEGFATYFQALYYEHWLGPDDFTMELLGDAESYMNEDSTRYRRPVVEHRYANPEQMFDRHLYARGAWVLHMLRRSVGDDAFWSGIHLYLTRNRATAVETDDLRRAFEDATGRRLEGFFDRWLLHAGYPEFRIRSEWRPAAREYLLHVTQTQRLDARTPLFPDPLEFEVWPSQGPRTTVTLEMNQRETTLAIPMQDRPANVRFDPRLALLKRCDFEKTEREWLFQLSHSSDAWGRIEALRGLAGMARSDSAFAAVAAAMRTDPFWGVRREAASALGQFRGPLALRLLSPALNDRESRVRRGAAGALGKFLHDPRAAAWLTEAVAHDSSYGVRSEALHALARARAPRAYEEAVAALSLASFNDVLRVGALEALALTGDRRAIPVARAWCAPGRPERARAAAIAALGTLLREHKRDLPAAEEREHREFLVGLLEEDPNFGVRSNAAEALGKLGDAEAVEPLERAIRADIDFRVSDRAARSIEAIHMAEGDRGEARDLRRKLAEAESRERELQHRLDRLESATARR